MARSKKDTEAIRLSYEKGFRVVGQEVISALGTRKKIRFLGKKLVFRMKVRGRTTYVDVVGLSAYQKKMG